MPLPPALAARLAKRGIIRNQNTEEQEPDIDKAQEEIIAEDYDDKPQTLDVQENSPMEQFEKFQGWFACPNKWNVYHECTSYCCEQWAEPMETSRKYSKCRAKLLQKYPLPAHWQEILDAGLGRYYYWNTETDLVSWLPPAHPKCQVSRSAAELRKHMITERNERLKEEDLTQDDGKGSDFEESSDEENLDFGKERRAGRDEDESSDTSQDSLDGEILEPKEKSSRERRSHKEKSRERDRGGRRGRDRGREREKDRRSKRRSAADDKLDPMDPAAYSDCPRGNWASGLPERNEARTGVDPTASGPLFQMRPYPNPGAVLRANAQAGGIGPKKG